MSVINWALYTEAPVGHGHPTLADVLNRALRSVLSASGFDPDADFGTGFAKATDVLLNAGYIAGQINYGQAGGAVAKRVLQGGQSLTITENALAGTLTLAVTAIPNGLTTATSANTASAIVTRDANGDFAARTITANLAGNATTATALANSRNINGVPFDGSAPITVPASALTLTGATLNATVTLSSLTTVGVLASPHMTAPVVDAVGLTIGTAQYRLGGTTSATSVAATIYTISSTAVAGILLLVSGTDATHVFFDLICAAAGQTVQVITSTSLAGTPAAVRTYSLVGNTAIQLAMASGTYTVKVAPIEIN